MLGAIIGDVIGSIYEVDEINALKEKRNNYNNRVKILDKNTPLFNKECSYTDDTALTVSIAYALLSDKDYGKYLKEFGLKEVSKGLDKYGRNRFSRGFIEWLNGNYIGESYGNGCAMRISPIAYYFKDLNTILEETKKATYPSHNNCESYTAAYAVNTCIYLAKNKYTKEEIKKIIEKEYNYNLNFNLEYLQKNYKFTSRAKDSVPHAIFCFLKSNSFLDAIRKSISIGGDSDTIASITGSIAEAYYGIEEKLIKQVEKYLPEYVINIVNDFYLKINKEKPFKHEVKDFFKEENLYSEEFFDFIKNKIFIVPNNSGFIDFGCFPKLENGILKDMRLLVPEIITLKDILINIHEYYHAFQLFNELGTIYDEKKDIREKQAIEMEKRYKKRKSI